MSDKAFFADIRSRFPVLERRFGERTIAYMDSAATTLKPVEVIKRVSDHYLYESSNVHRGAHRLSDEATRMFEDARTKVASFIGAQMEEIVFTRNTTESVNLIAQSWGGANLKSGDVILLTRMEHHGNIVPWQLIAERVGARIEVAELAADHTLDEADLLSKIAMGPKVLAISGASNALGIRPNLPKILAAAKKAGVTTVVDAAQLVSQKPIDVKSLGCDFLVFSGHKLFGPTGIGVLFGRKEILDSMPPYQGGGSMISLVTFEKTTYHDVPFRFEAGTPHIAGAIGLAAAIDFTTAIGWEKLDRWEHHLLNLATKGLREIQDVIIYADVADKGPILSFNIKGQHHSDIAQILDQQGVAVRAGHHCTQPLMKVLGVPGTLRASFSVYNDEGDVERLIQAVRKAKEMLQ